MRTISTRNYLSAILLFILSSGLSFGQSTISSVQSGSWNSPTTWTGGVIPTPTDNAIITSGTTVTISTGAGETILDLII